MYDLSVQVRRMTTNPKPSGESSDAVSGKTVKVEEIKPEEDDSSHSCRTFVIHNEDHTLGNALRFVVHCPYDHSILNFCVFCRYFVMPIVCVHTDLLQIRLVKLLTSERTHAVPRPASL